jgi:general secretion pathway protein E
MNLKDFLDDKKALKEVIPPTTKPPEIFFDTINLSDLSSEPQMINGIQPKLMRQWKLLPFFIDENVVKIAMADPSDLYIREILENVYGKIVMPYRTSEEDILSTIYKWYEAGVDIQSSDSAGDSRLEEELWDDPEQLRDMASEAPVIRLVNHLISQALEYRASDIHFEAFKDSFKVRFRMDGVLKDTETISKKLQPAITSRIKLMAKMNIAEMRLPQDGRIKVKEGEREIDIRVSTLPTLFGESIVLRLLNREEVKLDLNFIGFNKDILEQFEGIIQRPYGMVLVTGPTGSGKTTTLYSAMNKINSPDKKIITIEDPVEYQLDGINQIHVKSKIGLTFAAALRTILRQDPDVILVGEIRDGETAEIAVQSALTGHLVFSTLHTNDASSAITRLQEMGVESYLLASSLLAVMAQRLVRKICRHCKEEIDLPSIFAEEVKKLFHAKPIEIPAKIWKGKGCSHCANTGYQGRTGIYEFLPVNDDVRKLVMQGVDSKTIFDKANKEGVRSLREDGFLKVFSGITTLEEILRVTN